MTERARFADDLDADSGSADEGFGPYLQLIKRRGRLLTILSLAIGFVTGVILLFVPRHYVASASFVAQEPSGGGGLGKLGGLAGMATSMLGGGAGGGSGLGGISSALGGSSTTPEFYAALLMSTELLDSVTNHPYHSTRPDGLNGDLVQYLGLHKKTRVEDELAAIKSLRKKILDVEIDIKSQLIQLKVETKDPEVSRQIAERMLLLVNQFNLQRLQNQADAERDFTAVRSHEASHDLETAELGLTAFDEANRSVLQSPRLQTERAGLQRRIEIAQQVYLNLVEEYEAARVQAVRNTPMISIIDSPGRLVEPLSRLIPIKALLTTIGAFCFGAILVLIVDRRHLRQAEAPPSSGGFGPSAEALAAAD